MTERLKKAVMEVIARAVYQSCPVGSGSAHRCYTVPCAAVTELRAAMAKEVRQVAEREKGEVD